MELFQLLAAALAGGTVLLFGMLGGIFTERSGVMNLAIEGYMLLGATISYSAFASSGSPWIGLLMGAVAAAILGILHAIICISLKADQVVSGLATNFVGTGVSLVLKRYAMIGDGLSHVGFAALAFATALDLDPIRVSIPVTVLVAFLLLRINESAAIRGDSAVAMISVGSLAAGVLIISVRQYICP